MNLNTSLFKFPHYSIRKKSLGKTGSICPLWYQSYEQNLNAETKQCIVLCRYTQTSCTWNYKEVDD